MSYEVVNAIKKDSSAKFVQFKPGMDYPHDIIKEDENGAFVEGPDGRQTVNSGDYVRVDDLSKVSVVNEGDFNDKWMKQ